MLTPFWWDDFIMACSFTGWYDTHTKLLSDLHDVIASTYTMYKTWHGRSVADFLNFLFMFFKNKEIFNVANTLVYCFFVYLICFHITGSIRKIRSVLFLFINIMLWLSLPAWGQNVLWLTGSFNYLWTGTIILAFLIPYRKRVDNPDYIPHTIVSVLWIFPGILAGWSIENSAAGILILLAAYFILKVVAKRQFALFEIMGSAGFLAGFFMLISARHNVFPSLLQLILNIFRVGLYFLYYDGFILGIIAAIGIELTYFRKLHIPKSAYIFFIAAFGSVAAMIIPGYFGGRSCFITQTFLIITLTILTVELVRHIPRRYVFIACTFIILFFIPSFIRGTKSIVESYLLSVAREEYILTEKENGNLNVKVKTPIFVNDSHSGMYGGIDILSDSDDIEYIAHNSPKVTWYGIQTLDGIVTDRNKDLKATIGYFLRHRKPENLTVKDLLTMIYENW
jgi:hypothetical protein